MKLKYKKAILLTTMSTMGIGILTLSISQDHPKAKESINNNVEQESGEGDSAPDAAAYAAVDISGEPTIMPTLTLTPSPMPSPTPTPKPVYDFEEETPEEIVAFIKDYYVAKSSCDADKIKSMSSDPSRAVTLEQLKKEVMDLHIEDYRNIKCYAKKSYEEGSYIIYTYYEIKFAGITTPASALTRDYLVTDGDGNLKTFTGDMDPELKEYYDERLEDDDVQKLRAYTEKKKEEEIARDEVLADYWNFLDGANKKDKAAEGSSGV